MEPKPRDVFFDGPPHERPLFDAEGDEIIASQYAGQAPMGGESMVNVTSVSPDGDVHTEAMYLPDALEVVKEQP